MIRAFLETGYPQSNNLHCAQNQLSRSQRLRIAGPDLPFLGSRRQRCGAAPAVEEPMGLGKIWGQGGIVDVRVAGVDIRFSCDFG